MGFFSKIGEGLKKTRNAVNEAVGNIVKSFTRVDEELFEELEETLITCDIGVATSTKICDMLYPLPSAERTSVKTLSTTIPSRQQAFITHFFPLLMRFKAYPMKQI